MRQQRVLILDDAKPVRDRVQRALEGQTVAVLATESWAEAHAVIFSSDPPDLLVLDLQMPTIDGKAVGRAVKRRLPMPIVLFSSEDAGRLMEAVRYIGAEAGVSKSAPDRDLVETVLRLLETARERRPAAPGR